GTEQRRTVGSNEARSCSLVAIETQPYLCYRPNVSLPASDYDSLGASGLKFKPFRQWSRQHGKSSARVHKQLNFFGAPCRACQSSFYGKVPYQTPARRRCLV